MKHEQKAGDGFAARPVLTVTAFPATPRRAQVLALCECRLP